MFDIKDLGVDKILEKFIGDKSERDKAKAELEKAIQENKKVPLGVMFEQGAIPSLFWLFFLVMLNNMFIVPYVEFFTGLEFPKVGLDPAFTSLLETVTIWLFGKKGIQKVSENLKKN